MIAAALLLFAAVTCQKDLAQAKLAQALALNEDAKAQAAAIPELEELVAEDERNLAQERANPSGVVSMRRLHEIGDALVQHRQALELAHRTKAADDAAARKLLAEASAITAACKRAP